ncbi:hypothetical protein [Trueperella pyogenes]|uniref:hypothetical protein n=1 Tax=Trueperella pyogenes TaxID=1661 RepID=UPI00117C1CE2|nr:hypothetical protein [Trueperella pyogenes]
MHNTDVALGLIGECARLGIHTVALPAILADDDPSYVERVSHKAQRRGIRVLPHVGSAVFQHAPDLNAADRYAVLSQWFSHGALGVELGTIDLEESGVNAAGHHVHAGWDGHELLAFVKGLNPDAIVSANLRSASIENAAAHALEHYLDLVRFETSAPRVLDQHNYADEISSYLQLFEAAGLSPSWNCSVPTLDNYAGMLTDGAILLAAAFFPGFLHFEQNIPGRSPSLRHALRLRDALGLHRSSILLNIELAQDGFVWLINDKLTMLLNFGPYTYAVPNDGTVIVSSLIELPEEAGRLIIPPGEAAWLRR